MLAVLAVTQQGKSESSSPIDLESVKDSELPKQVEVTEALKVRLLNDRGTGGIVGLPAGAKVEVTGRSGNMLKIVFAKSAGQIDIAKTTALDEIGKIRAANKTVEEKRAAPATSSESPEPAVTPATKAESEPEKEIPVSEYRRLLLAYSWTFSTWSGKPDFSAPGDVPHVTYTFKKDRTWRSIARYRVSADGSPVLQDMGKWRLEGDKLKLYRSGLRFDPDQNIHTLRFVSATLLKFGDRWWTAEVQQAD